MAKRKKLEFPPTLKAEDFKDGETAIATGTILSIKDGVETEFGEKTILMVENSADGKQYGLFCNRITLNNLIDLYGDDDLMWVGKQVKIHCIKDDKYKQKMLVASSI